MHETIDLFRLSLQTPEPAIYTDRNGKHYLCPGCSVDWDVLNNEFRAGGEARALAGVIAHNCPDCYKKFGSWIKGGR